MTAHHTRYLALFTLFGLLWGSAVTWLSADIVPEAVWGGLLLSPLIGLTIGVGLSKTRSWGLPLRALAAAAGVYLGALMFGLGVGAWDWLLTDTTSRSGTAVMMQSMLAFPFGLTATGLLLFFVPAGWISLWLIERASGVTSHPTGDHTATALP